MTLQRPKPHISFGGVITQDAGGALRVVGPAWRVFAGERLVAWAGDLRGLKLRWARLDERLH